MKLTPKQKIGGVVCIVGAVAVGIDQLFVLPQEAAADRPPAPPVADGGSAGTPATDPAEVADGSISTARAAIADRLEKVAAQRGFDLEGVPNAFAPPKSWLLVEAPDGPRTTRMTAAEFARTHTLTGVMAVGDGGYAIIDGRMLFIGQELDGFELIQVSERTALFELQGVRVELMLPE